MKKIIGVISVAIFVLGMTSCQKKSVVVINSAADLEGKKSVVKQELPASFTFKRA